MFVAEFYLLQQSLNFICFNSQAFAFVILMLYCRSTCTSTCIIILYIMETGVTGPCSCLPERVRVVLGQMPIYHSENWSYDKMSPTPHKLSEVVKRRNGVARDSKRSFLRLCSYQSTSERLLYRTNTTLYYSAQVHGALIAQRYI